MRLQPLTGNPGLLTLTTMTALATTVACGGGSAPELDGLSDQVAQVGIELKVDLNGTDPDGDQLLYDFNPVDLTDLDDRTSLTVSPSGAGVFRWTPNAQDVGEHVFDFTVSDGSNSTTVTITIDVRSAIGSATAPVFRQPLGTGTTIDLAKRKCVNLDIVIEDQDTAQIDITQEDPIEGADLRQNDGLTATWEWCPTKEQENEKYHTLVLAANDGDNPKTVKNYLVVLRGGAGTNCPGASPSISHTPQDASTGADLTIDATVTDDLGLKSDPLFYYSLTPPANPPVLSDMIQLSTIRIDGTPQSAVYAADVPNPVAGMPAGTSQTIYYVFVADDDDDAMGNCDHSTVSQVYEMTVTAATAVNQPVCSTCSTDAQCGTGDFCVNVGGQGNYCMQSCDGGCPTGYTCSASNVTSVDGAVGRQCIPNSGSCTAPAEMCMDDTNEEDDTRAQAMANGPSDLAFADYVSCPRTTPGAGAPSDDDWFQFVITADTKADVWLYGDDGTDVDLHMYKADGAVLSQSTSLQPEENIVKCLTAGTYYLKVNEWKKKRSDYILDMVKVPQTCQTTCTDDAREDDDTYSQARSAFDGYVSTGNKICPNDVDRFKVTLAAGQRLTIDLTFTQTSVSGDIDVGLFRDGLGGQDLWPCSIDNVDECSVNRGQSADSDEHAEFTATTAGVYQVEVRGWGAATNDYDIAIAID